MEFTPPRRKRRKSKKYSRIHPLGVDEERADTGNHRNNDDCNSNSNTDSNKNKTRTMLSDLQDPMTGFRQLCDREEEDNDDEEEEQNAAALPNESSNGNSTTAAATMAANHSPSTATSTISEFDAVMHLVKGNLGPGCLNIPHAFALSGWVLGLGLFSLVALQGIYSMVLLVHCKQWLLKDYSQRRKRQIQTQMQMEAQRESQEEQQPPQLTPPPALALALAPPPPLPPLPPLKTFADVARVALGPSGAAAVQLLLFVLQAGVCCVFLSLVATNLRALNHHLTEDACIAMVTVALLGIVLIRDLKELKWLSVGANCLMLVAVLTASGTAVWVLWEKKRSNHNDDDGDDNNNNNNNDNDNDHENDRAKMWTNDPAAIATFVASMFYAFEGIGLVLPVENSFVGSSMATGSCDDDDDEQEEDGTLAGGMSASALEVDAEQHEMASSTRNRTSQKSRIQRFVQPVLLGSMAIVAGLFLLIGATCGPAFPNLADGSVTAYLTTRYPESLWYQLVNASVMVAVFATFPLQLTPAMEVLEEWINGGCGYGCGFRVAFASWKRKSGRHTRIAQDEENDQDGLAREPSPELASGDFCDEPTEAEPSSSSTGEDNDGLFLDEDVETAASSLFVRYSWVLRRWCVVGGCAVVVATVHDLGLLVGLFGALGNTGLAAMPCVVHQALVRRGIAPYRRILLVLDACTILVSVSVAVTGVAVSIRELLREQRQR